MKTGRLVLVSAVALAAFRLALGGLVALVALGWPEAHAMLMADVPTVLAYLVFERLGCPFSAAGAFDLRFLGLAVVSWSLCGVLVTLGVLLARRLARLWGKPGG